MYHDVDTWPKWRKPQWMCWSCYALIIYYYFFSKTGKKIERQKYLTSKNYRYRERLEKLGLSTLS